MTEAAVAGRADGVPWWPAVLAAVGAVAADVLYVMIMWDPHRDNLRGRVVFFAGSMLILAVTVLLGRLWIGRPMGVAFAWAAMAGLLGIVVLGMWSIGILLLPPAALAFGSAIASSSARPPVPGTWFAGVTGACSALLVLGTGLALT